MKYYSERVIKGKGLLSSIPPIHQFLLLCVSEQTQVEASCRASLLQSVRSSSSCITWCSYSCWCCGDKSWWTVTFCFSWKLEPTYTQFSFYTQVNIFSSSLCSAFSRGSCLLQETPGFIIWQRQRKRPVPLLTTGTTGPPALQQRQQPNSQSVPAAQFFRQLGPPSAATRPATPTQGPPAGSLAAWLLSITSQPVTPAASADAQRQPQWQRGGPDHGKGGKEPVALPQPAGGGVPTGSTFTASTQVSICTTAAPVEADGCLIHTGCVGWDVIRRCCCHHVHAD